MTNHDPRTDDDLRAEDAEREMRAELERIRWTGPADLCPSCCEVGAPCRCDRDAESGDDGRPWLFQADRS